MDFESTAYNIRCLPLSGGVVSLDEGRHFYVEGSRTEDVKWVVPHKQMTGVGGLIDVEPDDIDVRGSGAFILTRGVLAAILCYKVISREGGYTMSYPKPLTERSLSKRYSEAGITEKQIHFLKDFFTAATNLYGVFTAKEAWDVYKELSEKTDVVSLRKKDMYTALGILRRDAVPFFVFKNDEVYSKEERTDDNRFIAIQEIVLPAYRKYMALWAVRSITNGRPFFVPPDFLEYTVMPENEYEHELLYILENLQSTLMEYEDNMGRLRPCKYTGKRLEDFSFIGDNEDFQLRRLRGEVSGYKGYPEQAEAYEAKVNSITAAQYLVNGLKWRNNIGYVSPAESITYFFHDLNEMGVAFSGLDQLDIILHAVNDMHNNQHLWSNRGWTPNDLAALYPNPNLTTLSFGAGLRQVFGNGGLEHNELIRRLKKMGIEVWG